MTYAFPAQPIAWGLDDGLRFLGRFVGLFAVVALAISGVSAADDAESLEFFEKRIRPVLVNHCYECHSSSAKTLEGNLSLETRDAARKGGNQGAAIIPGNPRYSLLLRALRYEDENLQMPPKEKLPKEVIADFEKWIQSGAADPRAGAPTTRGTGLDFEEARNRWSFTSPIEPSIPDPADRSWANNSIDRFILAKLESQSLAPVADADRRTLLRRVTYDLIGIPPTPEEVEAFLADPSPNAFAAVVDRLLASPQYGERWGRHWLDVVRYADTAGDNSDYPIPQMYLYRNWVIEAMNDDKPFDQFIVEQLAGDRLASESVVEKNQRFIATGYIANARRFGSRVSDYPQHLTIEDTIDNFGRAFLGLSLNCARCHNHKFDPVTTEDYYGLYGVFHSTRYPWPGIELEKRQRDLVPLAPADEVAAVLAARRTKFDELDRSATDAEKARKGAAQALGNATKELDAASRESPKNDELVSALEARQREAKKSLDQAEKAAKEARQKRDEFEKSPLPFAQAYAVADAQKIEDVKVQIKGDPERLGTMVERRIPVVFGGKVLAADSAGSGRLELAQWVANRDNPLTARVIANRLWHFHFGKGIVTTPNDFGRQGQPSTHPELLDHLAIQLMDRGWSLKAIHRKILLSRAYQMSCQEEPKAMQVDPSNTFVWRQNRRRLEAEAIRDAMLALSLDLDWTRGGPHPFPDQKDWDFTQHNPFKAVYESPRRSVYLMTQRIQRHPFLAIFDGPDTNASTGNRTTSTTTLQALYLLNDQFVHARAARFAERLRQLGSDDTARIRQAYEHALARPPSDTELAAAQEYLAKAAGQLGSSEEATAEAWRSFCRVLFRMNEFVYLN